MRKFLHRTILLFSIALVGTVAPATAQESSMETEPNVVETAVQTDGFNTLVKALKAAGLAEDLQGEGPLTVFAPTDEAFEALPDGRLESLLQPENRDQLRAVLRYHILSGAAMASDVTGVDTAPTFEGRSIQFQTEDGEVRLMGENAATVVKSDIGASNGVIHVIDSVLLPPEKDMGGM